jgi:hypothetical protein
MNAITYNRFTIAPIITFLSEFGVKGVPSADSKLVFRWVTKRPRKWPVWKIFYAFGVGATAEAIAVLASFFLTIEHILIH